MSSRIINILLFIVLAVAPAAADRPFTLVLDPGHGGKDLGCSGSKMNEKDIVLDVALKVGDILAEEHPRVKTLFTRKDDRFVALTDRAAIANKNSADLFVSIHVNSVDKKTRGRENIHGASVYTLGLHRSDDNLAVAMRENSVIELEPDFSETYQGFDPSSSESYIIFELTQNRHMHQSLSLADEIQQHLVKDAGRADKGVLQSGFLVLRATSMPSVLVELDFICNREAENFLASDEGRLKCARSIADAFSSYLERYGRGGEPGTTAAKPANPSASKPAKSRQFYSVQIAALPSKADIPSAFAGVDDVVETVSGSGVKYSSGHYSTLKEAKKALARLRKSYPGAFVVKLRQ